jgi:hypothetical protein
MDHESFCGLLMNTPTAGGHFSAGRLRIASDKASSGEAKTWQHPASTVDCAVNSILFERYVDLSYSAEFQQKDSGAGYPINRSKSIKGHSPCPPECTFMKKVKDRLREVSETIADIKTEISEAKLKGNPNLAEVLWLYRERMTAKGRYREILKDKKISKSKAHNLVLLWDRFRQDWTRIPGVKSIPARKLAVIAQHAKNKTMSTEELINLCQKRAAQIRRGTVEDLVALLKGEPRKTTIDVHFPPPFSSRFLRNGRGLTITWKGQFDQGGVARCIADALRAFCAQQTEPNKTLCPPRWT